MTSPSRRKHPTTARSTPAGRTTTKSRRLFRLAASALLGGALAWTGLQADSAQAQAPNRFTVDAQARPISSGPSVSAAPLRWRNKQAGVVTASAEAVEPQQSYDTQPEVAQVTLTLNGPAREPQLAAPQPLHVDSQVRPVAQRGSAMADPFGDRVAQLEGANNGQLYNEVGPDRPAFPVEPEDVRGPRGNRGSFDPREAPSITDPGTETAPMEQYQPADKRPCNRIYNERDCCDVDGTCRAFVASLMADGIDDVLLDITPRYMPDVALEEEIATRIDRLRLAGSREWHTRDGRVAATGSLGNLLNSRVQVIDDAGNEVAQIPIQQLADDEMCFIAGWWRIPAECGLNDPRGVSRNWMPSTYAWQASALCHKPLYFEEVQLERYGHTAGPFLQPVLSGAHFFGSFIALPYQMAISPPGECEYALGYYRPGSCAPWHIPPIPFSVRGAAAQAGFVVGGIYVLP